MKYLGSMSDPKDLINKEYVDNSLLSKAWFLGTATYVPNGTDYNSFLNIGTYRVANVAAAQTMINCPVEVAHILIVQQGPTSESTFYQMILTNSCKLMCRYYSTTWSNWQDLSGGSTVKVGSIDISAGSSGSGPYTQTVTVTGVQITENSIVSLTPTPDQIATFISRGVTAMTIENNSGVLTLNIFGNPPGAMTVSCTVVEAAT